MKKILLIGAILLPLCFGACSQKEQQGNAAADQQVPEDPRYSQDMQRDGSDSLDVLNLTKQYLDLLQAQKVDAALDMLHVMADGELQPLSDERRAEIRASLSTYPVLNYTIETMLLYSETDTEVRYSYEFFQKPEGMDQMNNTMRGGLFPHRVDGQWFLTVPIEKSEPNR